MANPFVHVELQSTDIKKARDFYGRLFDWKLEDSQMPGFGTYAAVRNIPAALAATDGKNAHIRYADTNAQGYGYAKITSTEIVSTLVTVNRPTLLPSPGLPGVRRTATVTIPKVDGVTVTEATMSTATVTGTKPFPIT